MKTMKSSLLCAASVTGLVLSATAFAADSAAYKDAVSAAKSDYKSAVAVCKDMKSDQRSTCMKDAKADEKLALNKAQDMRGDGKSMSKAAPGAKNNDVSAKPMQEADKPMDKTAPAGADAPASESAAPTK
jgi:hypothetical protein